MLIDSHAHLTMPEYSDLDAVLARASAADVKIIINVSFDIESSQKSVDLAARFENIYAAVGLHPSGADKISDQDFVKLKDLAKNKKVAAIGETGLDYYYAKEKKDIQKTLFLRHIALAKELSLPIIVHDRDAHDDIFIEDVPGVFHCFSGDVDFAKKVLDHGYFISFVGNITFKNAQVLRDVVKFVPLERIMLETDCPYMSPDPLRGTRNEPGNIPIIAKAVAAIKSISVEEVSRVTTNNAKELFRIA